MRVITTSSAYVVKTFKAKSSTISNDENSGELEKNKGAVRVVDHDLLPIKAKPIEATEAFDIWSYGTILYTLFACRPLFGVDRDDNIITCISMGELYRWNDESKSTKMTDEEDPFTKAFLSKLLSRQPKERGSMSTALKNAFFDDKKRVLEAEKSEANRCIKNLEEGQKNIQKIILDGQESMKKIILRAMLSVSTATVPTLWILSKGDRRVKKWGLYDKYELRMLCQITGRCKHTPVELSILKAKSAAALRKAAPLIKFTLLLLKIGSAAAKLYGVPIPTELPFLEGVRPKDVGTYLDEWSKHFESIEHGLENAPKREDFTDATSSDEDMSKLCMWKERNENSGLETCQQLRSLLNTFGKEKPYTDEGIAKVSGLQKMVNVRDGSCIWVDQSDDAKEIAKKQGYEIEAALKKSSDS